MLSPNDIQPPRFQLWQRITVDNRPAVIVGSYYLSPITALKIDADCWGWQYAIDYLEAMSIDEAIACTRDATEFVDETYLLEGKDSNIRTTVELKLGDLEPVIENFKSSVEWQEMSLAQKVKVLLREKMEVHNVH